MARYGEDGAGCGYMALRFCTDWQRQRQHSNNEPYFHPVRFHSLLFEDIDIGNEASQKFYTIHNTDVIYEFLLSTDIQPFWKLIFPVRLISGAKIVFHSRRNNRPFLRLCGVGKTGFHPGPASGRAAWCSGSSELEL